jgi:tetratricopeptide (TPR) repeat protein
MEATIKTLRILLVVVFLIPSFQFQLHAQDPEKGKIITVINDELMSFINKDYDKWASYWDHSTKIRRISVSSGYYGEILGWDSLSQAFKQYFDSPEEGYKATKGDFDIRIKADLAVVHLVEKTENTSSNQTILLEKHGKDWKIVEMYSFFLSTYENNDETIEANLNTQGYNLLARSKVDDAIKVFKLNSEFFPGSWNTWDSLAEGYMKLGDNEKAIEYYQKSLDLNPDNANARKYLTELKK